MRAHRPNFFIVGAPKCGTSAMNSYLSAHPEIFMSPVKEPHFFCTDLKPMHGIRDPKAYEALYEGGNGQPVIGEASASYLFSEVAAQNIKDYAPDARILIMLREPVSMIYSLHSQAIASGLEWEPDFEKAALADEAREEDPKVRNVAFLRYRSAARYARQVTRYFEVFGRDRVKVVLFDDLKDHTAAAYRDILTFLDIDPTFQPEFVRVNENRRPRSLAVARFIQQVKPKKGTRGNVVQRKFVSALRKWNNVYEKRPAMREAFKLQLEQEFQPEIIELQTLLGRDLSAWLGQSTSTQASDR